MSFIEWCQKKGLALESSESKSPIRGAKKVPDTDKTSGASRKFKDDLNDYKGNVEPSGTVEPWELVKKGKGKAK
jgi:hypothetical protein